MDDEVLESNGNSAHVADVLVVSDVRLLRDGLADSLARFASVRVTGTAAGVAEAFAALAAAPPEHTPAVVLLDLGTADALSLVRALHERRDGVRVVTFAVAETPSAVIACAEAGVSGYVSRDASVQELVTAIELARRDETYCSPKVAGGLFQRLAALAGERLRAQPASAPAEPLTAREREIVALIDRGLANKEIARTLGIELATVKNHVHNLIEKLGASGRGDAAARVRSMRAPPQRSGEEPVMRG